MMYDILHGSPPHAEQKIQSRPSPVTDVTGLHATYRLDQDFCVRRAQYVLLIMYNNKNIRSRSDSNPQSLGPAPKCGALDRSANV